MIQYPSALPIEAVSLLAEIVKNRQLGTRKKEAAKAAWNIQGYAQKMLLGDVEVGADAETVEEILEGMFDLDQSFTEFEQEGFNFSAIGPGDEEPGNILVVISIISVAVQIIRMIRERREEKKENQVGSEEVGCDKDDCDCTDETPTDN